MIIKPAEHANIIYYSILYQFPKPSTNQRAYALSIMKIIRGGGGEASRLSGPWRKQPREKTQGTRLWQRINFVKEDGLNYPGSGPFLFS
jgi:hypothetical protein